MNPFIDCTWHKEPAAGAPIWRGARPNVWVCKSAGAGEVVATIRVGADGPGGKGIASFDTLWGASGQAPDVEDAQRQVGVLLLAEAERWAASDVLKPVEFAERVDRMSAEDRFDLLCEIYLAYHQTQLRPPCQLYLDGRRYNVIMRVTQPTARGLVLQSPNYLAVAQDWEQGFYEARKSKTPIAVPLTVVFIPAEQELLHQMAIVQAQMSFEESRRAEMHVMANSDDPDLQQKISELAVVDPTTSWGSVDLDDA